MKPAQVCRHVRTKAMYVPEQKDQELPDTGKAAEYSGHCWCNRTLTEVGPDDKRVGIPMCGPARSCFEQ